MREHIIVEKDWGVETWFENNDLYCGKFLTCTGHKWSSDGWYHYHPIKDETFFVIEGALLLDVEGEEHRLERYQSFRILPGQRHRFRSIGRVCHFIEVSTSHSDDDSIRVEGLK